MTQENAIEAYRDFIRARARVLVGGLRGRGKLDPVYAAYCEDRDGPGLDQWRKYSSCGDLVQGLTLEMGCSLPFVNREALDGWRPGRNLLDFYDGTGKARHSALKTWNAANGTPAELSNDVPGCGAFCFVWSDHGRDAHTLVAGRTFTGPKGEPLLETFNFGAGGMSPTEFPGAKQVNAVLRDCWQVTLNTGTIGQVYLPHGQTRSLRAGEKSQRKLTGLWIGGRRLRYVLDVPQLLELCDEDKLPEMTGEWIDAIEAQTLDYETAPE